MFCEHVPQRQLNPKLKPRTKKNNQNPTKQHYKHTRSISAIVLITVSLAFFLHRTDLCFEIKRLSSVNTQNSKKYIKKTNNETLGTTVVGAIAQACAPEASESAPACARACLASAAGAGGGVAYSPTGITTCYFIGLFCYSLFFLLLALSISIYTSNFFFQNLFMCVYCRLHLFSLKQVFLHFLLIAMLI